MLPLDEGFYMILIRLPCDPKQTLALSQRSEIEAWIRCREVYHFQMDYFQALTSIDCCNALLSLHLI